MHDLLTSFDLERFTKHSTMTTDIATSLSSFNNTKLYVHSQRDEFFRRGVSVQSSANATDDTKTEENTKTTRMIDPSVHDVNPLELDADIAHFKVIYPWHNADIRNTFQT